MSLGWRGGLQLRLLQNRIVVNCPCTTTAGAILSAEVQVEILARRIQEQEFGRIPPSQAPRSRTLLRLQPPQLQPIDARPPTVPTAATLRALLVAFHLPLAAAETTGPGARGFEPAVEGDFAGSLAGPCCG